MDYPKSVPNVGLVNGKFVDENTTTGQVGSLIPADWGSAVTDELLNVIRAGALEPSETDRNQLLLAIRAIIQGEIPDEEVRTTLEAYGITDAYTKSKVYSKTEVDALLKNLSALPVGSMVPFPKGTVPPGFLEVDGSVQSIATYPDLSAYLGTAFNVGSEGAGNFRLPESRGEFLRGWDHGRGVDAGRGIGSSQLGAVEAHAHDAGYYNSSNNAINSAFNRKEAYSPAYSSGLTSVAMTPSGGGTETRPRNLAVMWCIKAWSAPTSQGLIDIAALALEVQKQKPIAIVGGHKNLMLSASGLSAMVNVSADQLIVGAGELVSSLSGINLSFNGLIKGANGLDTGVLAASTWYSVWVIWNGVTAAGLLSLSATAPTLPAGYTHKARAGWIRTDTTANRFPVAFSQFGRQVRYVVGAGSNVVALPSMAGGVLGSPTTGAWVPVSVDPFIPVTASVIDFFAWSQTAGSYYMVAESNSYGAYLSATNPPPISSGASAASSAVDFWRSMSRLMLSSGRNIYCAATSADFNIRCLGWEDNL